mmetsp:Transcript_29852/g.100536  ORF Transcript_29852/g.100536 Transcript_29852/m.100536 type:complete len:284 (+) Transcript_29852:2113-2964(+)
MALIKSSITISPLKTWSTWSKNASKSSSWTPSLRTAVSKSGNVTLPASSAKPKRKRRQSAAPRFLDAAARPLFKADWTRQRSFVDRAGWTTSAFLDRHTCIAASRASFKEVRACFEEPWRRMKMMRSLTETRPDASASRRFQRHRRSFSDVSKFNPGNRDRTTLTSCAKSNSNPRPSNSLSILCQLPHARCHLSARSFICETKKVQCSSEKSGHEESLARYINAENESAGTCPICSQSIRPQNARSSYLEMSKTKRRWTAELKSSNVNRLPWKNGDHQLPCGD